MSVSQEDQLAEGSIIAVENADCQLRPILCKANHVQQGQLMISAMEGSAKPHLSIHKF